MHLSAQHYAALIIHITSIVESLLVVKFGVSCATRASVHGHRSHDRLLISPVCAPCRRVVVVAEHVGWKHGQGGFVGVTRLNGKDIMKELRADFRVVH